MMDDKTQKLLPREFSDGRLGCIGALHDHLEHKMGLKPVAVTLASEYLKDFSPTGMTRVTTCDPGLTMATSC